MNTLTKDLDPTKDDNSWLDLQTIYLKNYNNLYFKETGPEVYNIDIFPQIPTKITILPLGNFQISQKSRIRKNLVLFIIVSHVDLMYFVL